VKGIEIMNLPKNARLFRGARGCLLLASVVVVAMALLSCSGQSSTSSDQTTVSKMAASDTTLDPTIASSSMNGYKIIDNLTVERFTHISDIIMVGEITQIDAPKWNGPGGTYTTYAEEDSPLPIVYTTFYVKPTQLLKGKPKWGSPVAFRMLGIVSPSDTGSPQPLLAVGVGQTVVVFGQDDKKRYGGGVYDPADAYWLTGGEDSVWGESAGEFINQGLTKQKDEKKLSLTSLKSKVSRYTDSQP
jgi:hypothetical protein